MDFKLEYLLLFPRLVILYYLINIYLLFQTYFFKEFSYHSERFYRETLCPRIFVKCA